MHVFRLWGKPEHPENIQAHTVRICKLHTEKNTRSDRDSNRLRFGRAGMQKPCIVLMSEQSKTNEEPKKTESSLKADCWSFILASNEMLNVFLPRMTVDFAPKTCVENALGWNLLMDSVSKQSLPQCLKPALLLNYTVVNVDGTMLFQAPARYEIWSRKASLSPWVWMCIPQNVYITLLNKSHREVLQIDLCWHLKDSPKILHSSSCLSGRHANEWPKIEFESPVTK